MRSHVRTWMGNFGWQIALAKQISLKKTVGLVLLVLVLIGGFGTVECRAADRLAADAAYNAAAAMTSSGEYTMARDAWLEFLKDYPDDSQQTYARHFLGVSLYQLKDFDGAYQQFGLVVQDPKFPNRDEALYYQALAQFEKARLQLGRRISGPKKDVVNTVAERKEEPLPETKKLYNDAIRLFRQLLKDFPQSKYAADARYYLGVSFRMLGYDDDAVKLLQQVAADKQSPLQNQALYALAEIHLDQKRPESEKALKLLDQLLAVKLETSLWVKTLRLRADVLFQLKRYEEAAGAFAELFGNEAFAAYRNPASENKAILNVANAYYRYGETLVQLRKDVEAIPYFEFILQNYQNTPNVPFVSYQLALAMQRVNVETQKVNPSAKLPHATDKILGLWQAILDDPQTQRENALRVATIHQLVSHYLKAKEPAKALALLSRVAEQTTSVVLICDKANTFVALKRADEAIEQFRRIFELNSVGTSTRNVAADAMYQVIRLYGTQKDFAKVVATVDEVTQWKEFPQVSEDLRVAVLHEKASALYQLRQFMPAREMWQDLAKRFPQHKQVNVWMTWTAYAMLQGKDYQAVADFLTPYLKSDAVQKCQLLQVELNHLLGTSFLMEAKTLESDARTQKLTQAVQALETAYNLLDFTMEKAPEKANTEAVVTSSENESPAATPATPAKVGYRRYERAEALLYDLATTYLLQKNYERGEVILHLLPQAFPQSKELDKAAFLLGQGLVEQEKFAEANEAFQAMAKQFPASSLVPKALFAASQCCLKLGKTQEAIELTSRSQESLQRGGLDTRGANVRALAAMETNDFDTALAAWKEIYVSEQPEMKALRPDALFGMGFCELQKGAYAEAEQHVALLLNEVPDWNHAERAYALQIQAMLAQKVPVEGAKKSEKATSAPTEVEIQLKDVSLESGLCCKKLPEVEALLAAMAQKYPNSSYFREASYWTGLALLAEKRFAEAIPHFEQARNEDWKDSVNLQAISKQAWSLFYQNKLEEAASFANQLQEKIVIATDFTDEQKQAARALQAELCYLLGVCLFEMKQDDRTDSALECLLKVLEGEDLDEPFRQNAVEVVVQIYENRSQWPEVLKWTDHFTRKYPGCDGVARVLYKRAFAQYVQKELEQAEFTCHEVLKTSDKLFISKAFFLLGEIQFAQNKLEEAVKTFYKVVYGLKEPKLQADALYETARCFEAMEKPEQAKKHFQQLLKQFPESDKSLIAKQKLAEME